MRHLKQAVFYKKIPECRADIAVFRSAETNVGPTFTSPIGRVAQFPFTIYGLDAYNLPMRIPKSWDNPNDPKGWWPELKSWAYTLVMIVCNNGMDEPPLPFGQTEPEDIRAACDKWLHDLFLQEKASIHNRPPVQLRSWIYARLLVLDQYVCDQIEAHAKSPDYKEIPEALEDLLVTQWNKHLSVWWLEFSYDGANVKFRSETVLVRRGGDMAMTQEDHETAVTWKNLHHYAEMLAAAFALRVEIKLPFGQMPTPQMDGKCDRWLKKFFAGGDPQRMVENCPVDVAAWVAARLTVVTGVAFGNMQHNPKPPTEAALWIALRNLSITGWNSTLKRLWPGIYQKEDGTVGFRSDPTVEHLQSKGIFFSMN